MPGKEKAPPKMTKGRASLLGLMRRYLAAVMDPAVSLLEIHKLLYFMQEAGEDLRLRYEKGVYGPYAEDLRHVLSRIEGHFVIGYGAGDDRPDTQIEALSGAPERAEEYLAHHPETRARFHRVADLISGFETPFGMELLATVHWVASREGAVNEQDAIRKTYAWGERKRAFQERQIRTVWSVLDQKGWL